MRRLLKILPVFLCLCAPAAAEESAANRSAEFEAGAARAIDHVCAWLDAPRSPTKGTAIQGSQVGRRRVTQALVALAIVTHAKRARWEASLRRIRRDLYAYVRDGEGSQETWQLAAVGLLLGLGPDWGPAERRAADDLVYRLESGQNKEGGWGHDPSLHRNTGTSYPSTLMAATAQSMAVLGLLHRRGLEVDDEVSRSALALLEDVQSPAGGLPYGGRAYRKGVEAGRTSAALLALAALGVSDAAPFDRARRFTERHLAEITRGHASASMHLMWGALGCRAGGPRLWSRYRTEVLAPTLERQGSDGGFDAPSGGTADDLELMGTPASRRAYVTACTAVALQVGSMQRLEPLMAEDGRDAKPQPLPTVRVQARWRTPQPATALVRVGTAIWAAQVGPLRIGPIDPGSGKPVGAGFGPGTEWSKGVAMRLMASQSGAALAIVRRVMAGPAKARRTALGGGRFVQSVGPGVKHDLLCIDPAGKLRWRLSLTLAPAHFDVGNGRAFLLGPDGSLRGVEIETGALAFERRIPGIGTNGGLWALDDGGCLVASDLVLRRLSKDGSAVWSQRARGSSGLVPPVFAGLAADQTTAFVARGNGDVFAVDLTDGSNRWRAATRSTVESLAIGSDAVFLIGHDDRVWALSAAEGRVLWHRDLPRVRVAAERSHISARPGTVLVTAPRAGRTLRLSPTSGAVKLHVAISPHAQAILEGADVLIASPASGLARFAPILR